MNWKQKISKLSQINNKAVKQLLKLIIIISLFICNNVQSQNTIKDTIAFKREFEALLKKHGIKSNIYSINVSSNNQSGGQTAFVINNNYYRDTISNKYNFEYNIINRTGKKILSVKPKSGSWLYPFALTNSSNEIINLLTSSHGNGMVSDLNGTPVTLQGKEYILNGRSCNCPCNKIPIEFFIDVDDPNQIIIFGDLSDPEKTYIYNQQKVIWLSTQGE